MRTLLSHAIIRGLAMVAAVMIAGIVGYFSLVPADQAPAPHIWDKARHFIAYAAFAAPLAISLGAGRGRVVLCLAIAVLYGMGLEAAQMIGEAGREGSWRDVLANLSGAVAGLAGAVWLRGDFRLFGRNRA